LRFCAPVFPAAQIAETLPEEVLSKMHAAPKEHDVLDPKDLAEYDGE